MLLSQTMFKEDYIADCYKTLLINSKKIKSSNNILYNLSKINYVHTTFQLAKIFIPNYNIKIKIT